MDIRLLDEAEQRELNKIMEVDGMKSLEEHNQEMRKMYAMRYGKRTGVKCPECERELDFMNESILCSSPPKKEVVCDCGYYGYIVV